MSTSTRTTIIAATAFFALGLLVGRQCRPPAAPALLPLQAWDGFVDVDSLEHAEVDDTHLRLKVTRVAVEGEEGSETFAGGGRDLHHYRIRLPDGRTALYAVRLAE